MNSVYYVGVDLGGTSIKVGVCDERGTLLSELEGPTETSRGHEGVLQNVELYVRKAVDQGPCSWDQIQGIGAGIPGFMDIPNGFVKASPNLGWKDVNVTQILEKRLGKAIKINNDANVAALGEYWSGAGKGFSDVVCLTLGTGVGGGVIIRDSLCQGVNGMAGEIGHMNLVREDEAILCGCGKKGCLETVSSATGMIYMAKEAIARGEATTLAKEDTITAKQVLDHAKMGDPIANQIVDRAAMYLGKALAMISITINPGRYVIGGGVSKAGDFLFDQINRYYREYAIDSAQEGVEIVPAKLGNSAGIVGAAGLHLFG